MKDHLGVTEDDPQPLETAAPEIALPVPEVLVPILDNHQAADHLKTDKLYVSDKFEALYSHLKFVMGQTSDSSQSAINN